MNDEWDKIDQRIIGFFDEPGVIRSSNHLLRAGGESGCYTDFDMVSNDPHICETISKKFTYEISLIQNQEDIEFLAFIYKATGGTVGMLKFASLLSVQTRLPNVIIRLDKELLSERLKLPSLETVPLTKRLLGLHALIITDHCTTGSEVLSAADVIENHSGKVIAVISLTANSHTIRMDKFAARGIEFRFLFSSDESGKIESNYSSVLPKSTRVSEIAMKD